MSCLDNDGHSSEDYGADWFAFRVRARHEKHVALQLREKMQECFVPLVRVTRRWGNRRADVEFPLFSGYVFCRAHRFRLLPILTTPGIVEVLRSGKSPVPVSDVEISAIKRTIEANLPIEISPYIALGQSVQVRSGPLKGIVGIVADHRRRDRLVLSVSLIRCSVLVNVNLQDIEGFELSGSALESHVEEVASDFKPLCEVPQPTALSTF